MLQEHYARQMQLRNELQKERKERIDIGRTAETLTAEKVALEVESRSLQRFKEKIPEICHQLKRLQTLQRCV
jgi:hypothetical protein